MASHIGYPVDSVSSPKLRTLDFRFAPNFTSTVASTSIKPNRGITSITRTATGTWSINLDDRYYALSSAQAIRQGANAAGVFRLANVSDVVSGHTGNTVIQLVHELAEAATDIAVASTNLVYVRLAFADSTIGF